VLWESQFFVSFGCTVVADSANAASGWLHLVWGSTHDLEFFCLGNLCKT
jgi:hypothetical protein